MAHRPIGPSAHRPIGPSARAARAPKRPGSCVCHVARARGEGFGREFRPTSSLTYSSHARAASSPSSTRSTSAVLLCNYSPVPPREGGSFFAPVETLHCRRLTFRDVRGQNRHVERASSGLADLGLPPRYLRGLLRTTETLGLPSPGERDCTS